MDPVGSIPFATIQALSKPQKNYLGYLIHTLNEENAPVHHKRWEELQPGDLVNDYLIRIYDIVVKHLPKRSHQSHDQNIHQAVNRFQEKIAHSSQQLQDWQTLLVAQLETFSTTVPHYLPSLTLLNDLGKNYGELHFNTLGSVLKKESKIIQLLETRIKQYQNRDISSPSLNLIIHSHDITEEYLQINFQNYWDRTNNFHSLLKEVNKDLSNFHFTHKQFQESFEKLSSKVESKKTLKDYTLNSMARVSLSSEKPIGFKLKNITSDQQKILFSLFELLEKKIDQIQTGEQQGDLPFDPFLSPLFDRVKLWAPFRNALKIQADDDLHDQVESLLSLIKTTDEEFKGKATLYSNYLGCHVDHSEWKEERSVYAAKNKTLTDISNRNKELQGKLQERIGVDVKGKISNEAAKKICQCHDISLEFLSLQIDSFHCHTQILLHDLHTLKASIDGMNQSIINYKYNFNYFVFLEENNLTPSHTNYIKFQLGTYDYINGVD